MTSKSSVRSKLGVLLRGLASGDALLAELKDAQPELLAALEAVLRELRGGGSTASEAAVVRLNGDTRESRSVDDAAAVLPAISFSCPRGKYDTYFCASRLLLEGAKGSVSVPYEAIERVVIMDSLPKDTKGHVLMMISLARDSQVMNGKTRLSSLVVKTIASKELTVSDPSVKGACLAGPEAVVLCQLLGKMGVGGANFFISPDPCVFCTAAGSMAITANVKVSEGFLFPLADAFCFVEKPPMLVPHAKIEAIEFLRASGSSSIFRMLIHCEDDSTIEFGQIASNHLGLLENYALSCGLKVGAPGSLSDEDVKREKLEEHEDEDSSDDEDFDPDAESSENEERDDGREENSDGSNNSSDEEDVEVESDDEISASRIKEHMEKEKSTKKRKTK